MTSITPEKINKQHVIIDVRTPAEYETEHIPHSFNIPLDDVAEYADAINEHDNIVVVCRSGKRATKACANIKGHVLKGGMQAYKKTGKPVVQGTPRWAIERQVRLVAGSLVLAGVATGFFVHPAGYLVSAFVGAGLAFAAITDSCMMGMLLTKLPYNKTAHNTKKIVTQLGAAR